MMFPRPALSLRGPRRLACLAALFPALSVAASDLDTLGVTLLRQVSPGLTGSGVRVAQPEDSVDDTGHAFQVNPGAVGQPAGLFTWTSDLGTAGVFPNAVGTASWHANLVAANFYGATNGPAPGVAHVDSYEANYFFNALIYPAHAPALPARIVNQSFVFAPEFADLVNTAYDNMAARHGTIFFSGVGNGGPVFPAGTAYNSLGVGVIGTSSAVGLTPDGRSKPDLVAPDEANIPASANSYSIPYAAGCGALLVQAALRGDGGGGAANTNAAADLRTVKALLLNGAVKPAGWTNGATTPLDARYGAGVVNVFNAWNQLTGGRHSFIEATTNAVGAAHPPGGAVANVPVAVGWDFNTITNSRQGANYREQVNHYYFAVTNGGTSTATATLVWNRQADQSAINNLNLYLYNVTSGALVLASTSAVDNVEHLFVPSLPPGRYDLQVQKVPGGQVSAGETYALAFEFFSLKIGLARAGTNVVISWPVAPAGFRLLAASTVTPGTVWAPVAGNAVVSNGLNVVTLPASGGGRYFRLVRP